MPFSDKITKKLFYYNTPHTRLGVFHKAVQKKHLGHREHTKLVGKTEGKNK